MLMQRGANVGRKWVYVRPHHVRSTYPHWLNDQHAKLHPAVACIEALQANAVALVAAYSA